MPAARFYLSPFDRPAQQPAFSTGWDVLGAGEFAVEPLRRSAYPVPNFNSQRYFSGTETLSAPANLMLVQYVTPPIAAQTISGTVSAQLLAYADAATDARAQMRVRVVSRDGTVERGVLVELDNASALASEFFTSPQNRIFPLGGAATVTPVDAEEGDRLVIELGARVHNTVTTSVSATLILGTLSGGGDLPVDQTTTSGRPWIELSSLELHHPANDDFANAIELTGASGSTTVDTEAATVEAGEPLTGYTWWEGNPDNLFEASETVWWKWVAPADGTAVFDTGGSQSDSGVTLGVWSGATIDTLTNIAENWGFQGAPAQVTFLATAAETYYLRLHGDSTGLYGLNWGVAPAIWLGPGTIDADQVVSGELASIHLVGSVDDGFAVSATVLQLESLPLALTGTVVDDLAFGRGDALMPLDNPPLIITLPVIPPGPGVLRWRLYDGVTTYTFELNPAKLSMSHQVNVSAESTAGGVAVLSQGSFQPTEMSATGTLLGKEQLDNLLLWARKRRRVHLYDHLGRRSEVVIRAFAPVPGRAREYPWRHDYTLSVLLLTEPVMV